MAAELVGLMDAERAVAMAAGTVLLWVASRAETLVLQMADLWVSRLVVCLVGGMVAERVVVSVATEAARRVDSRDCLRVEPRDSETAGLWASRTAVESAGPLAEAMAAWMVDLLDCAWVDLSGSLKVALAVAWLVAQKGDNWGCWMAEERAG